VRLGLLHVTSAAVFDHLDPTLHLVGPAVSQYKTDKRENHQEKTTKLNIPSINPEYIQGCISGYSLQPLSTHWTLVVIWIEEMFSKKECCKQCRHVRFRGTMTNINTQKSTKTHRTPRRNRHLKVKLIWVKRKSSGSMSSTMCLTPPAANYCCNKAYSIQKRYMSSMILCNKLGLCI